MKTLALAATLSIVTLLAACGDKAQTASTAYKKADSPGYAGVKDSPYVVPGWQAGDRVSWQNQLNERAKLQNEYVRVK
jgi:hypothetical protein